MTDLATELERTRISLSKIRKDQEQLLVAIKKLKENIDIRGIVRICNEGEK